MLYYGEENTIRIYVYPHIHNNSSKGIYFSQNQSTETRYCNEISPGKQVFSVAYQAKEIRSFDPAYQDVGALGLECQLD